MQATPQKPPEATPRDQAQSRERGRKELNLATAIKKTLGPGLLAQARAIAQDGIHALAYARSKA